MKKFLASLIALTMVAGVAAPAFAAEAQNCAFKDRSLCSVESIYTANENNH